MTGLGLLLEALGHPVFLDHKTITPGARWQASLQEGLDQADVFLVYWTASASRSDWVRREIEYFHGHYPDRPLVPVLGDETPLTELLHCYQTSDFLPLINELLALKRSMMHVGAKPAQIEAAILSRLEEAGIHLDGRQRKKLFRLFAVTGLAGLIGAPALTASDAGNRAIEALAQLTWVGSASLVVAVAIGIVLCNSLDGAQAEREIAVIKTGESRPADAWLGMWKLSSEDDPAVGDTLIIERNCDTYRIPVKGVTADDIHHISEKRLHFSEGPIEYDATMTAQGSATVTLAFPGSGKASRLQLKKVAGPAETVPSCDK